MHPSKNKVWLVCLPALVLLACGPVPKENVVGNAAPEPQEALGTSQQAVNLAVPYITQYQGLTSSNCDCGPASVAMILRHFGKGSGLTNSQLVAQVRARTGTSGCVNTGFGHLEAALDSYGGLTRSRISGNLTPEPDAQMQAMKDATNQGKPVIALVNGPSLGRSANYGDHWVVVKGFSSDGLYVYLNDPDNQPPRWTGWIQGGPITLAYSTFRTAAYNAAAGPYGIIVGGSTQPPPPTGPWCSANCGGGGWWCTGDGSCIQNGVPGHNYHCSGNNVAPDRDQACALGCHIAAAGYPDYCNYGNFCGGGSWCGNDCVNGHPKTLYNFTSGGSLSSVTQCSVGYANQSCAIAAAGYPDYCY